MIPGIDEKEPMYLAQLRSEGDALQHAMNAGSKQSVSATTYYICRHCNCTSSTRHMDCDSLGPTCTMTLTTWLSYVRDHKLVAELGPWASTLLGVDGKGSAFDGVPFYDPVAGSPGDTTMHTIVTVALLELEPHLRHLFDTTDLTPNKFNDALKNYTYAAKEKKDLPTTQSEKAFQPEHHILWSSAQTLCFVRNSMKILAEYVDRSDPHWQCWELLVRFVDQIYAPRFSWETLTEMRDTLKDHHTR
jgi:hypothetical protein